MPANNIQGTLASHRLLLLLTSLKIHKSTSSFLHWSFKTCQKNIKIIIGSENLLYTVKNTLEIRENWDFYYCDICGYIRSF
jgi:cytochrome c oxidase assembly protein Cox11